MVLRQLSKQLGVMVAIVISRGAKFQLVETDVLREESGQMIISFGVSPVLMPRRRLAWRTRGFMLVCEELSTMSGCRSCNYERHELSKWRKGFGDVGDGNDIDVTWNPSFNYLATKWQMSPRISSDISRRHPVLKLLFRSDKRPTNNNWRRCTNPQIS